MRIGPTNPNAVRPGQARPGARPPPNLGKPGPGAMPRPGARPPPNLGKPGPGAMPPPDVMPPPDRMRKTQMSEAEQLAKVLQMARSAPKPTGSMQQATQASPSTKHKGAVFDPSLAPKPAPRQSAPPSNTGNIGSIPKTPPPPVKPTTMGGRVNPMGSSMQTASGPGAMPPPAMKKGGSVSKASSRGDGIAQRGKTKGRYI